MTIDRCSGNGNIWNCRLIHSIVDLWYTHVVLYSPYVLPYFSSFTAHSPPVPTKILAVTESGGASAFFSNLESQSLITEGNALADQRGASFMTTCANFQQQSKSAQGWGLKGLILIVVHTWL